MGVVLYGPSLALNAGRVFSFHIVCAILQVKVIGENFFQEEYKFIRFPRLIFNNIRTRRFIEKMDILYTGTW